MSDFFNSPVFRSKASDKPYGAYSNIICKPRSPALKSSLRGNLACFSLLGFVTKNKEAPRKKGLSRVPRGTDLKCDGGVNEAGDRFVKSGDWVKKIGLMSDQVSTDLNSPSAIPYFLWDEPMSVAELKHKLGSASDAERNRMLGKILREARDTDVWQFTTPKFVREHWDELEKHLGRRREFWRFLFEFWEEEGLLG